MKTPKSAIFFLLIALATVVLSSCGSSRKMGCPGAITSAEVKKNHI